MWRRALVAGSKVDAVKLDTDYNLKVWSKAEVTAVNQDIISIHFINDAYKMDRVLYWYSSDLAEYNTKSEGDEWRCELKAGDVIDAFDSTRIWYAATVTERATRFDDNIEYLSLKIGFRVYHPDGNK